MRCAIPKLQSYRGQRSWAILKTQSVSEWQLNCLNFVYLLNQLLNKYVPEPLSLSIKMRKINKLPMSMYTQNYT